MRLDRQPAGNLTINITKPGGGPVSVSPSSLTFSTTNWNTPRTVTLRGPSEQSGIQDRPDTLFHFTVAGTGISSVLGAIIADTAPGAAERVRIRILTEQLWSEYYGADTTHPGPPRIESVIRTSGPEHTRKSVVGFHVTFTEPVLADPGDFDVPGVNGEWFRVERRIEHYDDQDRLMEAGDPLYKPCNYDHYHIMNRLGILPGWDLVNRLDNECWRRKDMSRHWFVLTSAWAGNAVVELAPHAGHDIEDAWGNKLAWGPATWPTGDDYQFYRKGGATTGPGPGNRVIWRATLTVEKVATEENYGFRVFATRPNLNFGALDPRTFNAPGGGVTTVHQLWWDANFTTVDLNFEVSPTLPSGHGDWTLHVGGEQAKLGDAGTLGSGAGGTALSWLGFFTGSFPASGECDVCITTDGSGCGGSCRASGASGPSGTRAPQPQVPQPVVLPFAATVTVDKTVVPVGRGIDAACSPQGSYQEPHTYAWRAVQNAWDSAARTYDNSLPPVDTGSIRPADRPVARWTAYRPARAGIEGPVRLSCVITDANGEQATADAPPIAVYIPGTPVPDPFPDTWTTVAGTEAPDPQAPEPVTGPGGPDAIDPPEDPEPEPEVIEPVEEPEPEVIEPVEERDTDLVGVAVRASSDFLKITDGQTASYQVVLEGPPTHDVTVAVEKDFGPPRLSASPAALVFTTDNWDRPQRVTVSAQVDSDSLGGNGLFYHTVTSDDAWYDGLAPADVRVRSTDFDNFAAGSGFRGWLARLPAQHNGNNFTVRLGFDAAPHDLTTGEIRNYVIAMQGGSIVGVQPVNSRAYTLTVRPNGNSDVVMTLRPTGSCSSVSDVCTQRNGALQPLQIGYEAWIPGPLN